MFVLRVLVLASVVAGLSVGFGAPRKVKAAKKEYNKASLTRLDEAYRRLKHERIFDCYCGARQGDKLFFVGKIATTAPGDAAVAALKWALDPHARSLQPLLAKKPLDFFIAPGNTEVAVAQGKQLLDAVDVGTTTKISSQELGFAPEVYAKGEEGYYVRRETATLSTTTTPSLNQDDDDDASKT